MQRGKKPRMRFLIDNWELTLALVAAAAVFVLDIFGIGDQGVLEETTLVILGLLALTLFRIHARLPDPSSSLKFRRREELPALSDFFHGATKIQIVGPSLVGLLSNYDRVLSDHLKRGGNSELHVIVLDPEAKDLLEHVAEAVNITAESLRTDVTAAVQRIRDILKSADRPNSLVPSYLPMYTPFTLILVDAQSRKGRILVEFHCADPNPAERPNLLLTSGSEPYWFAYFLERWNEISRRSQRWPEKA